MPDAQIARQAFQTVFMEDFADQPGVLAAVIITHRPARIGSYDAAGFLSPVLQRREPVRIDRLSALRFLLPADELISISQNKKAGKDARSLSALTSTTILYHGACEKSNSLLQRVVL